MGGWAGGLAEHGLVQHRSLGGHVGRGLDRRGGLCTRFSLYLLLLDLQAFSLFVSCACIDVL
jgi:hypothetical protein